MKGVKNLFRHGRGDRPPPPPRPPSRRPLYGGLLLSSLVAMGSTFEAVRVQRYYSQASENDVDGSGSGGGGSHQSAAVGFAAATFLLSLSMIALQLMPRTAHLIVGTRLELALLLLAAGFACATVGTATNPATGTAVNSSGGVGFGNLYYSSWVAFACALALLMSFLRTERGVDVAGELEVRGRRFRLWCISAVASLVAMGSSAACYDARCGDDSDFRPPKYCRRAAFGVSAGCIGCVTCLAVAAARLTLAKREGDGEASRPNKVLFLAECVCSAVLLCFHCFAAAYLTSEEGPGAPVGNLYYSTWIAFGLIFFIAASCFEEYQAAKSMYLKNQQGGTSEGGHGSMDTTSHSSREVLASKEDNAPAEPSREEESGSRLSSLIGTRSGSVGEVQI